ncbi:hypothetical protein BJV74DRAFT_771463 [Russula compacta]|nr:hypothetical protein BJV74DRAFT_771463 [Russula compacta]
MSSLVPPGNTVGDSPRRFGDELAPYQCSWADCRKSFGTLNDLDTHIATQNHGKKRNVAVFNDHRNQWREAWKSESERFRRMEQVWERYFMPGPHEQPPKSSHEMEGLYGLEVHGPTMATTSVCVVPPSPPPYESLSYDTEGETMVDQEVDRGEKKDASNTDEEQPSLNLDKALQYIAAERANLSAPREHSVQWGDSSTSDDPSSRRRQQAPPHQQLLERMHGN